MAGTEGTTASTGGAVYWASSSVTCSTPRTCSAPGLSTTAVSKAYSNKLAAT